MSFCKIFHTPVKAEYYACREKFSNNIIMIKKFMITFFLIICISLLITSCDEDKNQVFTILATTDLHGTILPYDFIEKKKQMYHLHILLHI
jgi:hypothetical protein